MRDIHQGIQLRTRNRIEYSCCGQWPMSRICWATATRRTSRAPSGASPAPVRGSIGRRTHT